ncbi:MAG: DUF4404 family protein, partial [Chloroflexota bacterium]|nr:DUF4404 family protein [Chloroflexota bacterium]
KGNMDNRQLRETLEQLHSQLGQAQPVDDSTRQVLQHLMKDIEQVLKIPGDIPAQHANSLSARLTASLKHFEDSHSDLTLTIKQVLDNLAQV